ncbi:MAG: hypothetical protein DHS80DRAFT_30192 [Piptocephalis tieghemiana]|nr:MAG: hypothetical protein DHS80DRAFT_30192 [Piptocephalis tieghemiana]
MADRKRPSSPAHGSRVRGDLISVSTASPPSTSPSATPDASGMVPPPLKKQATMKRHAFSTSSNGTSASSHPSSRAPSVATVPSYSISHTSYPPAPPVQMNDETIQSYQKEAIWRQMEEYRRSTFHLESQLSEARGREDRFKHLVADLDIGWDTTHQALDLLLGRLGGSKVSDTSSSQQQQVPSSSLLTTLLAQSSSFLSSSSSSSSMEETIISMGDSLRHILHRVVSRVQLLETAGTLGVSSMPSSSQGGDADSLREQCARLTERAKKAEVEAQLAKDSLQLQKDQTDQARESASRAEKLVDRLKLQLARAQAAAIPVDSSPSSSSSSPSSSPSYRPGLGSFRNDGSDLGPKDRAEALAMKKQLEEEVEEHRRVAKSRLAEIESLREDRIRLEQQVDQFCIQMAEVPESRILASGAYRALGAECLHLRDEVDRLREALDSTRAERDHLRSSRHTYASTLEAEERERRATLQAEVRRLEGDLARVRGNRDHLQQQLDVRYARDSAELVQNQEIRRLANTRKDRLVAMTLEVRRLRMHRAASQGDGDTVKFYASLPHPGGGVKKRGEGEGEAGGMDKGGGEREGEGSRRRAAWENGEGSPPEEGETQARGSTNRLGDQCGAGDDEEDEDSLSVEVERERRERALTRELTRVRKEATEAKARLRTWETASQSVRQTQELLEAQGTLALEVEELQGRIRDLERTYGLDQDATTTSSSQKEGGEGEDQGLEARLRRSCEEKDRKLKALQEQCAFATQMEAHLAGEVEALGSAWQRLEEQGAQKVLDLASKEDQVVTLLAEKAKQEQRCALLLRHKDTATNVAVALRRQQERDAEERRRLEEELASLRKQLASLEREMATTSAQATQWRREVEASKVGEKQAGERVKSTEARASEAQRVAEARVRQAEEATHLRKRREEEVVEWRKRFEELKASTSLSSGKGGGAGESNGGEEGGGGGANATAQLLEEYKRLLKCTSCHNRFKSHAILRCMHVFCKECIDLRLGTRQRKCPTCSESFGAGDVKQVYL